MKTGMTIELTNRRMQQEYGEGSEGDKSTNVYQWHFRGITLLYDTFIHASSDLAS
jgi:hypothetical protein